MADNVQVLSMTQAQIINKILSTKKLDIITENAFNENYFPAYRSEFNFIMDHYNNYNAIPDLVTFIQRFPNFDLFEVTETDKYLAEVLSEEYTYSKLAGVVQNAANLIQENSFKGLNYLKTELDKISTTDGVTGVDIISQAQERYDAYIDRKTNIDNWYISTGFPEMDAILHGIQLKEEFIVLFARTGQGKSFILTKMLESCWEFGKNVGYISPEMSPDKVGYRFDSAYKHFNNNHLNYGDDVQGYSEYIQELSKRTNKFIVSTPIDFNNQITVSKIRSFINKYNIEVLGIDGLSYMYDENRSKTDSRQMELTRISKELFDLSSELNVPIIAVVQANRSGVADGQEDLEIENIRDADGISYSATKIISIRNKFELGNIVLKVNKHRDGRTGDKFTYKWSPQTGEYTFIPSDTQDDSKTPEAMKEQKEKIELVKNMFSDDNPANVF